MGATETIMKKKLKSLCLSGAETCFPSEEIDTAPEQWRSQCLVARIQRDEWKSIATEALASFRCTQRPEIYPEGHWSQRVQSLLENVTEHTTPRNED